MHKLIIGCPFGNYLRWPGCTSTLGTYTREARGGFWKRLWKVISTVRYDPADRSWVNRLGLPNPGFLDYGSRVSGGLLDVKDKIVSIAAWRTEDWFHLINGLNYWTPMAVELNVSCPNTDEDDVSDYNHVYRQAAMLPCEVIVKLPPLGYEWHVWLAMDQGLTGFHCCNTLSVLEGGLSGKPLKPLSLTAVEYVAACGAQRIIGGGGVTSLMDAKDYLDAGATNVAVASVLFNPFLWGRIRRIAKELDRVKVTRAVPIPEEYDFRTYE